MSDQLGYLYGGRLCHIHHVGRAPGEEVPYHPGCRECVSRRGHLPEDQRDVAGDAQVFRRFSSFMAPIAGNAVISKYQRRAMGLGPNGNLTPPVTNIGVSGVSGDRPELCGDQRSLAGDGRPGDEGYKAAA